MIPPFIGMILEYGGEPRMRGDDPMSLKHKLKVLW